MSSPASLKLFGVPTLAALDGRSPVIFTAERRFQVLAYLAVRQNWVRRDELAALLWPEREMAQARSNLRKVLLLAKRVPGVGDIEQQADLLRWLPQTDLAVLERACLEGRFEEAAMQAGAPLMQGLEVGLPGDRGNWVLFERRRIEEQWRALCLRQLDKVRDEPERLAALAKQMLDADLSDESAVMASARAHAALGQPAIAIDTLERYARYVRSELSIEPSAQWQALRRSFEERTGDAVPGASATSSRPDSDTFIGRRNELAQVRQLLQEPECRLLTLLGFAGVGKSAIARVAMRNLSQAGFDPVAWIALEDLTQLAEVPGRVAAAIGATLAGTEDPWRQVASAIGTRRALLVLDNAEHLDLREPLKTLLMQCAEVKLLVTSRERLCVAGEWLLPLDPLPLPDEAESDPEVLRHYDAVRLFEARARPFARSFDIATHAGAVGRLVLAVGGSPLAIELAAGWTRMMSVDAIAEELEQSLQLLETGRPDERGLRAGFEQTWKRLSSVEREGAAKLSVLPGDFSRAMAQQVADVPLPLLAALADRSLLRSDPSSGRFSMHPLIKQWAAGRAAHPEVIHAAHSDFIAQWLGRYADSVQTLPRHVYGEIELELPHIRAAWRHMIDRRDAKGMRAITRGFGLFCEARGLWREGISVLQAACRTLEAAQIQNPAQDVLAALATLLRSLATLQYRSGQLAVAESTGRSLLKLARKAGDRTAWKAGLNIVGLSQWQRGLFDEARPFFEQARRLAVADGDEVGLSIFTSNTAMVDKASGRYDQALAGYRSSLDISRRRGKIDSVVSALNNMANIFRVQEKYDDAMACLDEAMGVCKQEGLASARPFVDVNLGLTHLQAGRVAEAKPHLARSLEDAHSHGEPMIEAAALLGQAEIELHQHNLSAARSRIDLALAIAERLPSAPLQAQCAFALGQVEFLGGHMQRGAALMQWGLGRPALNRADFDVLSRNMARLGLSATQSDAVVADMTLIQLLAQRSA